ncbi:hypothetical protein JCM3774_000078 [Rhodotorula dairenensis]
MATVRFPIPATNRLASLPVEALTRIFAHLLSAAVAHNDQLDTKGTVTRFHSKQPPPLEIGAYLKRLATFTPFPRDAIILAVVYLNRITHLPYTTEPDVHPVPLLAVRPPRLPPRAPHTAPRSRPWRSSAAAPDQGEETDVSRLAAPTSPIQAAAPLPPSPTISSVDRPRATPFLNSYTLHRLVLTALLIACKFSVDGTLSQTRAAKVGGVTPQELCKLEGEGLRLLGWSLMWSLDEIEAASREFERRGEQLGVIEAEQADRDSATPRSSSQLSASAPAATAGLLRTLEPLPPSPPLVGAAAFTLLPDDDLPSSRRNSNEHRRPAHPCRDPSSSACSSSSVPSSEASTSQPSSGSSSPFLSFKAAGVAAFRHNLLPDVVTSSARRSRRGSRAGDDQSTPPSSPSQTSVGEQSDLDEKEVCGSGHDAVAVEGPDHHGQVCSKRASMETVRRVEGMTLAG